MMDSQRQQIEHQVLSYYLPSNVFRFCNMGTSKPYLQAAAQTNDGAAYLLYFDLTTFPQQKPNVYVQQMLYTKSGQRMDSVSASNHTLTPHPNGWTQLCHYASDAWTPDVTLWKVYLKCRLWLEMYRAHLRTGKPIDYYLNHQSRSTTDMGRWG
ncbi:MAG: hypothetical protein LUD17_16270 [Bacteroidales bacterium]|nr:hypothetical protein [Bacteroidales bacterium]